MKLISFMRNGRPAFGCAEDDMMLDFSGFLGPHVTLRDILPAGLSVWQALADAVTAKDRLALDRAALRAPIPNARKFLSLGGNYHGHVEEARRRGLTPSNKQTWFNKQTSCINRPDGVIERPVVSHELDYEGELGVVIGKDAHRIKGEAAWAYVAGYVVINDVSVRDWQMRAPTHTLGKSFDTHGPFGPWITTADEIADPNDLEIQTHVNGDERQSGNTGDMIHSIPEMIEELTTVFTLQAGDVLSTGTPAGVGGLMEPPRWLVAGDVVRVAISGLGYIENSVADQAS